MAGTILFGIDVETANENALGFTRYGLETFEELEVPVTWYVTGKTLERYPDEFRAVDKSPLVDLQAHTYNHILLKTILVEVPEGQIVHNSTDFFMKRGASNEEIAEDLARCQGVFESVLGRRATALTGPWCYYRGLGDRPDLLEIVDGLGFRALRTFGRDERDGQPVPLRWQPRFYRVQGFPHILEILIHDYQDDFYWREFVKPAPGARYIDHLKEVADRVAAEGLVWSLCSHDHGCATREGFETKGTWYREIVRYAQGLGIRFLPISAYYREMAAAAGV
jgi:peptidoglycan/xylan/chitin deacetylase (PgdA/CDA1 family)